MEGRMNNITFLNANLKLLNSELNLNLVPLVTLFFEAVYHLHKNIFVKWLTSSTAAKMFGCSL